MARDRSTRCIANSSRRYRRVGLEKGGDAICRNDTGSVPVKIELIDNLRRGVVCLPHGYGMRMVMLDSENNVIEPGSIQWIAGSELRKNGQPAH